MEESKLPYKEIKSKVLRLLKDSVKKNKEKNLGLLFSGGLDSVLLAKLLKDMDIKFTCYTASVGESEDLRFARKAAKELGLKLKETIVSIEDFEKILKKVNITDVVHAGIAATFWIACEQAKKDKIETIFSGLGSEEIFADYERHRKAVDVNKECKKGLARMYEKDVVRDKIVTKKHDLKLKTPYLDSEVIDFALSIPGKYKVKNGLGKFVLREIALDLGISEELAMRRKKATQYGSNADKTIAKLAKLNKCKYKSEYLMKICKKKLAALFSTGKDSTYAMYLMKNNVKCLITIESSNTESYMYHTPNIKLAKLQAEAMKLPILIYSTSGVKEEELFDLKEALEEAKKKYDIDGVVTGALYSVYQKDRIEKVCKSLNLEVYSPLWHMDQEKEMKSLIKNKFKVIMVAIAAEGLDKSWLCKVLTEKDVEKLSSLAKKYGFNVAGEGGEFESFVLDCPLFHKKLVIEDASVSMESENCGKMIIKKVKLNSKT